MKLSKRITAIVTGAAVALFMCGCSAQGTAASSSAAAATAAASTTASTAASTAASSASSSAEVKNPSDMSKVTLDSAKWNYDADNDVYWQIGVVYCADPGADDIESMLAIMVRI